MTKVKALEKELERLTKVELRALREWFAEFDARVWNRQIEKDIAAGKLDAFAEKAVETHKRGQSSEL